MKDKREVKVVMLKRNYTNRKEHINLEDLVIIDL